MSETQILWLYPLVFHRVLAEARQRRRVDAKYAYLVVNDGYVPLRRREGALSLFLPYVKYGKWVCGYETVDFINLVLETIDDLSSFFKPKWRMNTC